MATREFSASAHPPTREQRGIRLYRDHGDDICHEDGTWFVPSQRDATSTYEVHLARRGEYCECSDFEFRGGTCVHIVAATIARTKTSPCSMCGERHRHRELHEVDEDHLTCFPGDLLCRSCARDHGVV